MAHCEKAMQLFKEGCNCSQAVFAAFCEELGIEKSEALRLSAGFGGGMGRMREVCGAVSGMVMVLSARYGAYDVSDQPKKAELYARIQETADKFKAENGSIVCRELLGLDGGKSAPLPEVRTPEYYKKRPCAELVGCAAQILEDYFAKNA